MIVLVIALCSLTIFQTLYILQTKKQLIEASSILNEITEGNLDRRLLANEDSVVSKIVYRINEIVIQNKQRLMETRKSEQAYKKMVTSLSHDIRTPLASLVGYLEVLEKGTVTEEEHDQFLKVAKAKALYLNEYVQSLFEWLRLESGEWIYHFEEQNVSELIRVILADWILKFENSNLDFHFDIPEEPVYLLLDKSAFERILNNLFTNIFKHSKADQLNVSLKKSDNEIIIEISDNGIGISLADQPFIFDRLYKCDNSRTESSNGLGLAIVRELVSLAHGTITVSSRPACGTTFVLTFALNMINE
ncbi:sensor histidine kinase [Enterococcus sp. AZ072]|uniref:sensor histidine kinase n=1 Tax=unclassified Enterococcus TaxID=2608891 RepID=UPI003D2BE201